MNILLRKCNGIIRRYKDFRVRIGVRFLDVGGDEQIEKPIFLIGLEGGGLTLLSRILHRHRRVVYLTGNYRYWAGQDETYNLLSNVLPEQLTWRNLTQVRFRSRQYGSSKHGVLFAADEVLPFYRGVAEDVTPETKESFKTIIKKLIALNRPKGVKGPLRFVDKSQLYTLKVGLLRELFRECDPRFVLIIRNPFAWTWRMMKHFSLEYLPKLPDREWLKIASECWVNNIEVALGDGERADVSVWRFEDLLKDPKQIVSEICKFVELEFDMKMLPHAGDKIPWGSDHHAFTHKWYPFRPNVNEKFLKEIPGWAIRIVREKCGHLAERFHYSEHGP